MNCASTPTSHTRYSLPSPYTPANMKNGSVMDSIVPPKAVPTKLRVKLLGLCVTTAREASSEMYSGLMPAARYGGQMRMERCRNFGPMRIDASVGVLHLCSFDRLRLCSGVNTVGCHAAAHSFGRGPEKSRKQFRLMRLRLTAGPSPTSSGRLICRPQ